MKINLWYAVNGSGQAKVFSTQPVRDEKRRVWLGEIHSAVLRFIDYLETVCGYELPDTTWKDEPVIIEMLINDEREEY